MECRKIIYFGHVQGVNFRKNSFQCAQQVNVKGYVKNLPDGTVELVAEGSQQDLNKLNTMIRERMKDYIDHTEAVTIEPDENFSKFEIRR